jgi:dihydroflavonol-4-reductase
MSSSVLVTGGCGFIGQHLVAHLSAQGVRVRVLDIAAPEHLPATSEFLQGSVLDPTVLNRAVRGVRHVYHLAGTAHFWVPRKTDFALVNAVGTEMVLGAAGAQGVERVVHCSSETVLLPKSPPPDGAIDEGICPAFDDVPGPYTQSKHLAEQAALAAASDDLDVVIVNPTVPIGAEDRAMTPPAAMLAMFLNNAPPAFFDCMLNLVDVRDVAAGMVLAAERGRSGERYILGGENISLRGLLQLLEQLSGRPMPKRTLPAGVALATAAVAEWVADRVTGRPPVATREAIRIALRSAPFDSRKAQRELGYAPRPIQDALAQAVEWLCVSAADLRRRPALRPIATGWADRGRARLPAAGSLAPARGPASQPLKRKDALAPHLRRAEDGSGARRRR